MRRAVATVSLSGTLRHKLEAIAAARFDAIEIFEADFINFDGSAKDLGSMASDLGLGIDLYQPFRDFEGMPEALFRRSLDRAERKFDVMQQMGASMMLVCSNVSPHSLNDPELAAAQLHELAERASKRNIRIGFEALAWGRHVNLYRQAWAIVERGNHPHLGLVLDSFHTLSLKDDPSFISRIPGDKIFFVQMADAPLMAMDVLQWARHHRNFPGQGQFDVEGFFEQALLAGYSGTLSLEIFNDTFRETPNRRTAVDAMRSLLYLESQVRQRLEQRDKQRHEPAATAALERIELFDPPSPTRLGGFSFMEFAVDEAGAASLGALFERFGFECAGRHRSKAVTLYRQGRINLIVNAQPGSDARARFDLQGPTVCAIGISTPDPQRAVNRAVALQSARYDSPIGPSELQVPAVRSPGGMVVHFVPQALGETGLFEADFIIDSASKPTVATVANLARNGSGSPALTHIDHVALALATDQLDTWILFARAVLGLEPGDSLELADPFGLIRSSGVANDERSVRFVLNVSASQRTRTARALSTSGGAPTVHHIAMSTDNIFESVAALRRQGIDFVPISPNYYDDLATRYDLPEATLVQLRQSGILFDRNASGDYFHIYTTSHADRFFFEIVQRVQGYDAYGALNAPARLASQANASR